MILCEWDAPEEDPGQSCAHLFARILSSSLTSVSIFSVCCYPIVSISVVQTLSWWLEVGGVKTTENNIHWPRC
jgi:hypothetical protein